MSTMTDFFETDSTLGVFYPSGYLIAAFRDQQTAEKASLLLHKAGFSEKEILLVSGIEFLQYFEEFRAHSGMMAEVMSMLSRTFGTEQAYADDDIRRAQAGAGFLVIHVIRSPEEQDVHKIQKLLESIGPLAIHWYRTGGVESLI